MDEEKIRIKQMNADGCSINHIAKVLKISPIKVALEISGTYQNSIAAEEKENEKEKSKMNIKIIEGMISVAATTYSKTLLKETEFDEIADNLKQAVFSLYPITDEEFSGIKQRLKTQFGYNR